MENPATTDRTADRVPDLRSLETSRRRLLTVLGGGAGLGLLTLAGCGNGSGSSASPRASRRAATSLPGTSPTTAPAEAATATVTSAVPQETLGPYPGDGTNGPNYLNRSGAVRRDITTSLGSNAPRAGVPLTVKLTVLDLRNSARPLTDGAVYVWHCDRDGGYSMYQSLGDETFLRGVQPTDSSGTATFATIFPGAYSGRWPHIHFSVYPSVASATASSGKLTTSQIALPADACEAVYATDGYATSARNYPRTTLATDMVFRDGWSQELATVTGTAGSGMTASLVIGV